MMQTSALSFYPRAALFERRITKKPRALHTYKISPRTKHPPGWQAAQRLVKALVVDRIGPSPYFSVVGMFGVMRYRKVYCRLRAEYVAEDFPINP